MSSHHRQLSGPRWEQTRRAVFTRDGYRCTSCGRAGALEVHHVDPLHLGGSEYDLGNLSTLCKACHIAVHRRRLRPDEQAWADAVASFDTTP